MQTSHPSRGSNTIIQMLVNSKYPSIRDKDTVWVSIDTYFQNTTTPLTSSRIIACNLENNSNRQEHVDRDLKMISRWVKSELFKGCTFLYKGEKELDPKGKIHTLFERTCVPTLEGTKVIFANADDPPFTMELYKERIWALATKQRIMSNGLALRRSGVYTVMQNRFLGKSFYSLPCMWGSYWCLLYKPMPNTTASTAPQDLFKVCFENNVVFPACNAFVTRLENPGA